MVSISPIPPVTYPQAHHCHQLGKRLVEAVDRALGGTDAAATRVITIQAALTEQQVWHKVKDIDIERLRETTQATLRLKPLTDAGITTIGQVIALSDHDLQAIPGIGPTALAALRSACAAVCQAARAVSVPRIDPDHPTVETTDLLTALVHVLRAGQPAEALREWETSSGRGVRAAVADLVCARLRITWLFAGRTAKMRARQAATFLSATLTERALLDAQIGAIGEALRITPGQAWEIFRADPVACYTELERLTGSGRPSAAGRGELSAAIIARVERQELHLDLLRSSLRRYQDFGTRYLLAQRRTILGDEMGLGKTIQTLAAMCHLRQEGQTHFLVICPASVLITWRNEVLRHTDLTAHLIHGDDRERDIDTWQSEGGVAICTYEIMQTVAFPTGLIALLVVDEAHYIKNPEAKRSQAVARLISAVDRVALLSGTPLENRVDEFRTLVGYLDPTLAQDLPTAGAALGAAAFRAAVAPVYLRRNQSDVLMELPEKVELTDWLTPTSPELACYRGAVQAGNLMAMRQAAFVPPDSQKLTRLTEICAEAAASGHKVLCFSFFLDVLDRVAAALPGPVFGPLTGANTSQERQDMVDAFTSAPVGAVLVAQIAVGGTGLNIQAASVVILCEPQLKPSSEDQAIARAHRMGQLRTTTVHRLLLAETVDERIIELLQSKREIFRDYAATSEIAGRFAAASDPASPDVAVLLVTAEQARLGVGSTPRPTPCHPD